MVTGIGALMMTGRASSWLMGIAALLEVLIIALVRSARCRVCGERPLVSMGLEGLKKGKWSAPSAITECPVCGDPGDGSNPRGWRWGKL